MVLLPLHACNIVMLYVLNIIKPNLKIKIVPDPLFNFPIIKKSISAEENDRSSRSTSGNVAKQREPTAGFPLRDHIPYP